MILKKVRPAASIAAVIILTLSNAVSAFASGHSMVAIADGGVKEHCAHVEVAEERSIAFARWSDVVLDACSAICDAASFQLAQARFEKNADDIDAGAQKSNHPVWSLARHIFPKLFDREADLRKLPIYLLTLRFHL